MRRGASVSFLLPPAGRAGRPAPPPHPSARPARLVFVVSRRQPELYAFLQRNFGDVADVILDRRVAERRHPERAVSGGRRRAPRRQQRVDEEVRATGWAAARAAAGPA